MQLPTCTFIANHCAKTGHPRRSRILYLALLAAVAGMPAALAEDTTVTNAAGSSTPGCQTADECFVPSLVAISPGDTVTWTNTDNAAHTITSGNVNNGHDGLFDSGLFNPGTTFSHTFEHPGEYPYFCHVHPWMSGHVTVDVVSDTKIPVWASAITEYYERGLITEEEFTDAVRLVIDSYADGKIDRSNPDLVRGVTTRVIDGNTLDVDNVRIRLVLVDVHDSGNSTAPHAVFAREVCPVGSTTYYDVDDLQKIGPYGRTIAAVYCDGMSTSLNELLIRFDLGWVNEYYCDKSEHYDWAQDACGYESLDAYEIPEPVPAGDPAAHFMLDLINEARAEAGLDPVVLGSNTAAQSHADSMQRNCFSSHWGLDGLKPYMRYTLAGGTQHNAENLSGLNYCIKATDNFRSVSVYDDLRDAMDGLMTSPGHRDNILDPHHQTVNIGLAYDDYNMVVVQHFEYDFVTFLSPPAITGSVLSFEGYVRNGASLASDDDLGVQLYYDTTPQSLTRGQLARTYCYDSGTPVAAVRPPLPPNYYYTSDSFSSLYDRCQDPYDVDPATPPPRSYDEAHLVYDHVSQVMTTQFYHVPWIDAHEWDVSGNNFGVSVNISEILLEHGSGVYTVILWADAGGESIPAAEFSIFYR